MCFKKKKNNNLNKLPNEVIIYILKFLDLPKKKTYFYNYKLWKINDNSLIKFSETNKRYNYLVNKPFLWEFN